MSFFFFNDTATTEIYTLSLHDALPISVRGRELASDERSERCGTARGRARLRHTHGRRGRRLDCARAAVGGRDRKSTRLNSSHDQISYAVFCLKKKKNT